MNVSMSNSVTMASATGQTTGDAVGLSVLKKAMEVEAQNAMTLINAVSQSESSAVNLPSHLGQNVNTTA